MIYYTADLHLGHEKVIKMCNRPFSSVEEMNRTLINNINRTVSHNDDLFIVGDFSYRGGDPVKYLSQINGHLHLILGNHDRNIIGNPEARTYFDTVEEYSELVDNNRRVILFHYPIAEYNHFFRGAYHIYGHVHNNHNNEYYNFMKNMKNAFNCGVDVADFKPVTLDEMIENPLKFK